MQQLKKWRGMRRSSLSVYLSARKVGHHFLAVCLTAGGVFGRPADTVEEKKSTKF